MTSADCKSCQNQFADFLLDPNTVTNSNVEHLTSCEVCHSELNSLRATMSLMDEWTGPEPSAFFDVKLHARLRAEMDAKPEGLWERVSNYVRLSTGRSLRPAMVGALGAVLLLGGGTAVTLLAHHGSSPTASPTVNDLKIYDNNAQAVDQMDLLDDSVPSADSAPQS